MSHSTVAHRWFHQIGNKRTGENYFESGNMFYNQKIIYSYGKHFALGIRFDDLVVLNSKGYSPSTGKHQGITRGAIDSMTHDVMYVPFKEAYYFDYNMEQKNIFKCIDYSVFVRDFESDIDSLKRARKPEIYVRSIRGTQRQLKEIFDKFRGAKTYALKRTKGLRKVINFQFSEELLNKLKESEKARKQAEMEKAQRLYKKASKELTKWEQGKPVEMEIYKIARNLGLNTLVRVKDSVIETSKGMRIDLNEGLRVFNLWRQGKALGVEINTTDGLKWTCSKVNGIIKFGCHEVDFKQAERVLNPYL